MYPNFKAEMVRRRMNMQELADKLGLSTSALYARVRGEKDLTIKEALKIKEVLGVDMPVEELFATE